MKTRLMVLTIMSLLFLSRAFAMAGEIHDAAREGDIKRVRLLLQQNRLLVNAPGDEGRTPLHYAVMGGHKEMLEILILKGANVNTKDIQNLTPLDLASQENKQDIVLFLKSKGGAGSSSVPVGNSPTPSPKASPQPSETPTAKIQLTFTNMAHRLSGKDRIITTGTVQNTGTVQSVNSTFFLSFAGGDNKTHSRQSFTLGKMKPGESQQISVISSISGKVEKLEVRGSQISGTVEGEPVTLMPQIFSPMGYFEIIQ